MRAMAKRTSKAAVKSKPAPKSKPELKSKAKSKAKPEAATAKTPAADPKAAEAKTPDAKPAKPTTTPSAVEMGARQREISVSEFFTKNRHLLGFDNPRKALLTCVKEAVDNALGAAASEPGDPLPRDGDRQRAWDSPPADSADLREAPLRLEIPQAQNEPGPAGHRYLCGRHVRSADDWQAGADHLAHRRAGRRPLLRSSDRYQEERAEDCREQEDRLGAPARHAGGTGDRRALPEGPRLGRRVSRAGGHRQSARATRLPHAGGGDARVSADDSGAAASAQGDQAASLRDRVRHSPAHAARHEEPHARGVSRRRVQPGVLRRGPGDLRDGQAVAECEAAHY